MFKLIAELSNGKITEKYDIRLFSEKKHDINAVPFQFNLNQIIEQ